MTNAIDDLAEQAAIIRPEVFVIGRDFDELCVEIEAQLHHAESGDQPSLFLHGSDLVVAGRGRLQPLNQSLFVRELASRIAFVKRVREGEAWVIRPADPPGEHIASVFARRQSLDLPEVDRIAHTPFFGPDGVLQRKPGYHPAARVLYVGDSGVVIPDVPDNPTTSDVSSAYKLITEELLGDFRFAHPGDFAGALAAGLTPYVHPMIGGPTPIQGFDAPSNRAGKGLLLEALLAPACGRAWTTTPAPTRMEEWHKQIVAALRSGPLVAAFDNVNNKISSGVLASAVTAWPAFTSRQLGLSANVHLPLPAVWAVTGTNLRASTENAQRVNRIRIDPQCESPGHRKGPEPGVPWRHPNLRGWFTAHRGEIIAAWLTLIQAWIAAGRPVATVPAFGSFEQWTEIIGSILAFHGNHDLLSNRDEAADAMDDDQGSWHAFMAWWVQRAAEAAEKPALGYGLEGTPGKGTPGCGLEQTPDALAALAVGDDGPGCPADLSAITMEGRGIAMGMALRKIEGQRFGDHLLKTKRKNTGRVYYLEPVK